MKKAVLVSSAIVLVTVVAYATPTNPGQACNHAPSWLIALANSILTLLGYPPACS